MIIQAGEFWVADIPFTSGEGYKKRNSTSFNLLNHVLKQNAPILYDYWYPSY